MPHAYEPYEGFSPLPTGTTHTLLLTADEWDWLSHTLAELDRHQRWGNEEECATLRDAIRSRPWWPRSHQPGDHIQVRLAPRARVVVSRPQGR